ncbi:hypothetical protein GJ744_007946 [Endocarpon pusillum]|uniref:Uncharacterized protein n=1 Tax=Endocarpon pusillum TaxID=364733 RepID=A0A8H7E7B1_9EURO|nr:hypothetical protein GJ744_007946 [Endocarpon pusillum]
MQKLTAQDRPWSDHEKVSLLAEIIKISPVPANALVKLIRDYDVHPRWEDIPLPEGRSLNSSKLAFDELNRQAGLYQLHAPSSYSQQATQAQIAHTIPRKRQLPGSEALMPSSFPAIQPKPPGLSPAPYTPVPAEGSGSMRPSPGDSAGEPTKKRRGRPSNAQIEQEKAAAAAEGREWQPRPPRPPRKKKSKIDIDSPSRSEPDPAPKQTPQTPELEMVEAQDESLGGKKRRRKMKEDSTSVRPTPYDPIRQSPPITDSSVHASEITSHVSRGPGTTQQHFQDQPHVPTAPNLNPEHRHSTPQTHLYSDTSQHMQTEE